MKKMLFILLALGSFSSFAEVISVDCWVEVFKYIPNERGYFLNEPFKISILSNGTKVAKFEVIGMDLLKIKKVTKRKAMPFISIAGPDLITEKLPVYKIYFEDLSKENTRDLLHMMGEVNVEVVLNSLKVDTIKLKEVNPNPWMYGSDSFHSTIETETINNEKQSYVITTGCGVRQAF